MIESEHGKPEPARPREPARVLVWLAGLTFVALFVLMALTGWNTLQFQLMLVAGGSGLLIASRRYRKH